MTEKPGQTVDPGPSRYRLEQQRIIFLEKREWATLLTFLPFSEPCACVCVCVFPSKSEEGNRSLGALTVTGSCEPPALCPKN